MYKVDRMSKPWVIGIFFIVLLSIEANAQSVTKKIKVDAKQQQIAKLLSACGPSSEPLHKSYKRRSLSRLRAPKVRVLLAQRRAKCRYQKAKKQQLERERAKLLRKPLLLKYQTRVDS